jgi:hypothetical protein
MPHRPLRAAWRVAVVLTVVPSLSAQQAPRGTWLLGFGPNRSVASGYGGGGTIGLHILAGGSAQLSSRTALRNSRRWRSCKVARPPSRRASARRRYGGAGTAPGLHSATIT